jgi:hypothetical protein
LRRGCRCSDITQEYGKSIWGRGWRNRASSIFECTASSTGGWISCWSEK